MFRIHFLDVGRGDTTVLQFDNGRTYLIDYFAVIQKTTPIDYLTNHKPKALVTEGNILGVKELETVVITHPHQDHFLGIQQLIESQLAC